MGRYGIDWGNSEDDLTENDYNTIFVETSKIISLKTAGKSEVLAAFYNRGNVFHNRSEYQKAILDYSSAIELQNDFEPAYYNRGGVFYLLKNYDKALSDFKKAFEINPQDKDAKIWVDFLSNLIEKRNYTTTYKKT